MCRRLILFVCGLMCLLATVWLLVLCLVAVDSLFVAFDCYTIGGIVLDNYIYPCLV